MILPFKYVRSILADLSKTLSGLLKMIRYYMLSRHASKK